MWGYVPAYFHGCPWGQGWSRGGGREEGHMHRLCSFYGLGGWQFHTAFSNLAVFLGGTAHNVFFYSHCPSVRLFFGKKCYFSRPPTAQFVHSFREFLFVYLFFFAALRICLFLAASFHLLMHILTFSGPRGGTDGMVGLASEVCPPMLHLVRNANFMPQKFVPGQKI